MRAGIFFPRIGHKAGQHLLPALVTRQDTDEFLRILSELREKAEIAKCHTVLLSAEDFETFLIDLSGALDIVDLAKAAGYEVPHWAFVIRPQWDYFQSIYAESAKQRITMNFVRDARTALEFGELSFGWESTRWRFAFDYDRFFVKFMKSITSDISVFSFAEFTRTKRVGACLIDKLIASEPLSTRFWEEAIVMQESSNKRHGPYLVEFAYACNFLNLTPSQELFDKFEQEFLFLSRSRLRDIEDNREALAQDFRNKWPRSSEVFDIP